jgi:hypothetical protein
MIQRIIKNIISRLFLFDKGGVQKKRRPCVDLVQMTELALLFLSKSPINYASDSP